MKKLLPNENGGIEKQVDLKKLGLRIQMARKEVGMNQGKFSLKLGIHRVSLSKIERGDSGVAMDTIKKISELTGKPISYFFGEEKQEGDLLYVVRDLQKQIYVLREEIAEYKRGKS